MTPEAQRIAIAEACGWKLIEPVFGHDGRWRRHAYKGESIFSSFDSSWAGGPRDVIDDWENTPDYLHDLNAIQAAIKDKIEGYVDLEELFMKRLGEILDRRADDECRCICLMEVAYITCDASEYCEAFLFAIGKWVESEVEK